MSHLRDAIIGYVLTAIDTIVRAAEEALLKTGALQRAILNSANFSSIATDAHGVIQISHLLYVSFTQNGLWRFEDGKWSKVTGVGLSDGTATALFLDNRKRLWAGFFDGRIVVLDGNKASTFTTGSAPSFGCIQVFLKSKVGLLAGGSSGIAVLRADHLQPLLAEDQASLQGVSGLLEAANGDLWANGMEGIVRVRASEVAHAIDSPEYPMKSKLFAEAGVVGPAPQILSVPTAVKDLHGTMWFSTSGLLVSVDPESIHASLVAPILSRLSTTGDGLALAGDHRVNPGYHTMRIRYFGAYITAPQKVTYKYKLDGADKSWQEVGDRSEAVYTGLRPGHYRFAVMASNGEEVWSPVDDSLEFTVLPSFYQRPVFLILCVATALGLIWLAYRLRVRHIAAAIQEREQVRADERIRIARDLHDTLLQGMQGLTLRFSVAAKQLPEGSRTRE